MAKVSREIVLGVTGSIAAYKAAEIVRLLKREGHQVSVVMTEAATRFVGELTFRTLSQRPVSIDMFEPSETWCPDHIALAERAELLLVAPCTANVIAKMTHGLADDLLTCTVLATTAPILVAPAMNEKMWDNAVTRANIETLKSRGITIVDVGTGDLACGCQGRGRMAEVSDIVKVVERTLDESSS